MGDWNRRGSLKTYSRTKDRDRTKEAVFDEYALKSVKQSIFSPDGKKTEKVPATDEVKRKRQKNTSTLHGHGSLKKLKQDKNKKVALRVKIQRRPSQVISSHLLDSDQEDVLFGENVQFVMTRQKNNTRTKTVKDTTGPPRRRALRDKVEIKPGVPDSKGRSKRRSARKVFLQDKTMVSASDSKTLVLEKTESVLEPVPAVQDHVVSSDRKELSPETHVISPDRKELSPETHVVSSDRKELSLKTHVVSSDRKELFPETHVVGSDRKELSPETHVVSSDRKELSPETHVVSFERQELPPETQVRLEDKVGDWLARSNKNKSQHHDSSKEIWREQQFTGDEMRNGLFPEEFFDNLNKVLQKPKSHTVKTDKHAQDRFLSQLELRSMDQPFGSEPRTAETENDMSCNEEDVTFMYTDMHTKTQTGSQTETSTNMFTTGTATSRYTDTHSEVQTGTKSTMTDTATSRFTKNQSEVQTGSQTVTGTKSLTADTATVQSEIQSRTKIKTDKKSFTTDTVTSGHRLSRESKKQSGKVFSVRSHSINELADTQTDQPEMPDAGRSKPKGIEQALGASDVEQTIICKDAKVQKYLCSTMRRSGSTSSAFFPSELSSVTDSLKTQQKDEKTPKRMAEDFKMPGSPIKNVVFKGTGRKGTLQPKNSTKLFTSGFVEIVDVIPQMSTIVNDSGSKVSSPDKQSLQISFIEKKDTDRNQKQNIKTSTPNKVNFQGQPFQFEADISSVNIDSEDDDLLLFRESREVNSDECIHLSDVMFDIQQVYQSGGWSQVFDIKCRNKFFFASPVMSEILEKLLDATFVDKKVEVQPSEECEMIKPYQNKTVSITARTRKGKDHIKDESFNAPGKKTKVKRKSPVSKKPVRRSAPRAVQPQRSLSTHRRGSSGASHSPEQLNIVNNTSTKMLTNNNDPDEMICKITGNECKDKTLKKQTVLDSTESPVKVSSTKNGSYLKDVYNIDESTNNLPNPHFQKEAREESIFSKKPKGKRSIRERKLKLKTSGKRNSSEIHFKPRGQLGFTKTNHSASDRLFFAGYKNENYSMSDVERDGVIPVCALNQEFTCPKGSVSLIKFKKRDTRPRKEILDSVTIDVLQW